MNYSKSISRKAITKRNITFWIVIAIIFFIIGLIFAGLAFGKETEKEILVYGQADGKIFSGEIEYESDLQFIPLDVDMDAGLQEYTFYLSAAYDIDFTLVMALIKQESNFDTDAVSGTGDYGLMQINEINFDTITENLSINEFLEPHSNIKSGLFILRKLFEKYEDPEKVLMAYNMGETGASKLWEQGIYESNYSRCILLQQKEYASEIEGKRGINND